MAYKITQSKAPSAPSMYKAEANKLYGIDSSTSDDNVSFGRACGISYFDTERSDGAPAPGLMNMMRTNVGEVGKRNGIRRVNVTGTEIGYVTNSVSNVQITVLFDSGLNPYGMIRMIILRPNASGYDATVIQLDDFMDNKIHRCTFCELINKQIVAAFEPDRVLIATINDTNIVGRYISAEGVAEVTELGRSEFHSGFNGNFGNGIRIPTVYIGNIPVGGSGKDYEPVNLLSCYVCESFAGDGTSSNFTLSLTADEDNDLDVYAMVYDNPGNNMAGLINHDGWYGATCTATRNEDGSVTVTFYDLEIPPAPTITGEDNVRIYYKRNPADIAAGLAKIVGCTISTCHGVGGYKDRLFISGNSDYPNHIWYSEMDDYTYFGDLSYLTFSDSKCSVMAIAGQDTSLAVITDGNSYLVNGTVNSVESLNFTPDAIFNISRVFSSAEPISTHKPVVFDNEILYMSKLGLSAVTASNIMDERYTQIRSENVNYWLLKEDLAQCKMCVVDDFLVVSFGNDKMYVFDGTQYSQNPEKPFSYRQFEVYIFNGAAASFMWEYNNELYMLYGSEIGKLSFVCSENRDYVDDWMNKGAIPAYWETPNIYGSDFYNRKSFAKIGALIRKMINSSDGKEINTAVRIWAKKNNEPWELLKDYNGDQSIFRYDYMNYGLFSYRPVGKKYTVDKKIKLKKTYSLKLRFENDIEGMPFFLQAFGLEYTK